MSRFRTPCGMFAEAIRAVAGRVENILGRRNGAFVACCGAAGCCFVPAVPCSVAAAACCEAAVPRSVAAGGCLVVPHRCCVRAGGCRVHPVGCCVVPPAGEEQSSGQQQQSEGARNVAPAIWSAASRGVLRRFRTAGDSHPIYASLHAKALSPLCFASAVQETRPREWHMR